MFSMRVSSYSFLSCFRLPFIITHLFGSRAGAWIFDQALLLINDFGRRYIDGEFGGEESVGVGAEPDFL